MFERPVVQSIYFGDGLRRPVDRKRKKKLMD